MKIRRQAAEGIKIDMTPMIDVVFQLLAFFLMTFKINSPEGDFSIKMPEFAAGAATMEQTNLSLKLVMKANQDGTLASMSLDDQPVSSFEALHAKVVQRVGGSAAPASADSGPEIELACDQALKYENVIRAITAVSGDVDENKNVTKLIEKIKFAPPGKKG